MQLGFRTAAFILDMITNSSSDHCKQDITQHNKSTGKIASKETRDCPEDDDGVSGTRKLQVNWKK